MEDEDTIDVFTQQTGGVLPWHSWLFILRHTLLDFYCIERLLAQNELSESG